MEQANKMEQSGRSPETKDRPNKENGKKDGEGEIVK